MISSYLCRHLYIYIYIYIGVPRVVVTSRATRAGSGANRASLGGLTDPNHPNHAPADQQRDDTGGLLGDLGSSLLNLITYATPVANTANASAPLTSLEDVKLNNVNPEVACKACRDTGSVSQYLTQEHAQRTNTADPEDEAFSCKVCFGDGEFGLSRHCEHYFCSDCIRRSLEAMLETGQFPAYCPQCRADKKASEALPTTGINFHSLFVLSPSFLLVLSFSCLFLFSISQYHAVYNKDVIIFD